MRNGPTAYRFILGAALAAFLLLPAGGAIAGEYVVANCHSDPLNFSTRAFEDFVTRGMKIRRACNPEGPGVRGLITANVVRGGRVERNAMSVAKIKAPEGTRFSTFRWSGTLERSDCRYALQMWAGASDIDPIPIKNVRANQGCPRRPRAQAAGYEVETFNVPNAKYVVQRVICMGSESSKHCSARGSNYIRTYIAEVRVVDVLPPSATVLGDTPLARGEWVGGMQPLNYDAYDNVGVRMAHAVAGSQGGGFDQRPCAFATPERSFADKVPCPNGVGQITVNTARFGEGTQTLVVQAQDTAGNVSDSTPASARIDNTPPARVDVSVEGGDGWRNRNDFAVAWTNPSEADRAPITALTYELCSVGPGSCSHGEHSGSDISRFDIPVPAPGGWTLSLWRRDAAGNQTETAASVPVTLRYDPEPPSLGFESPSTTDPTLVAVAVTDDVSGLAGGAIEISPSGSGVWQSLPTDQQGSRLVARIDDAVLPAGGYMLRVRAFDRAANEASSNRRLDGQPMALNLPLRIVSSLRAGFERTRKVQRVIQRGGKRRVVRHRVRVVEPSTRVRFGGQATVVGRLVDRDGQGIAGAKVQVFSTSAISPEVLVAVLQTGADGRYRYTAAGSTSRTLRLAYAGSPLVLPAAHPITMAVPARTSLRPSRKRVLNGQAVTFRGRLRAQPPPPGGKLVELQVRLSDRWQTFRTSRTDTAGKWAIRYRFKRTRGLQRFRFRARLPREASYPFATGGSPPRTVKVRGPL